MLATQSYAFHYIMDGIDVRTDNGYTWSGPLFERKVKILDLTRNSGPNLKALNNNAGEIVSINLLLLRQ